MTLTRALPALARLGPSSSDDEAEPDKQSFEGKGGCGPLCGSRLDAHESAQARCVGAELRIGGGGRAGCKRVVATAAFGAAHARGLKLLHHFGLLETDRLRIEIKALQHLNETTDLDGLLRRERVRAG